MLISTHGFRYNYELMNAPDMTRFFQCCKTFNMFSLSTYRDGLYCSALYNKDIGMYDEVHETEMAADGTTTQTIAAQILL